MVLEDAITRNASSPANVYEASDVVNESKDDAIL
jgi:hypothetical protein